MTTQTIKLRLTKKQTVAWNLLHDAVTYEILFGGAAGGGKSRIGCTWLIEQCGKYPGSRWLMGRAELEALKKTTLLTFFDVAKEVFGMRAGVDYIYSLQAKTITFVQGGSQILLYDVGWYPSDPEYDRLGSLEICGGFVDEVGQITFKCWEILRSRIRYRLDEFGIIPKLLGSCNPTKAWPYLEFYRPFVAGKLPVHRSFVKALVTDNPFAPAVYIASLRALKDNATKQRLLFGNWEYDDDPSSLFPIDTIADMFAKVGTTTDELFISGDVSRRGRDKMPIGLWNGYHLRQVVEIPDDIRANTTQSAKFIIDFAAEHNVRRSHIILDEDGVGGGVVDQVPGCKGFVNNASPVITKAQKEKAGRTGQIVNYANLKSQCYHLCSLAADKGTIGITCSPEQMHTITEELEQVKQVNADKDSKWAVISKDLIKLAINRSPDYADMIMMRFRFDLPFEQLESKSAITPFLAGLPSR